MKHDPRLWNKLEETKDLPREERIRIMAELVEEIRKEAKHKERLIKELKDWIRGELRK